MGTTIAGVSYLITTLLRHHLLGRTLCFLERENLIMLKSARKLQVLSMVACGLGCSGSVWMGLVGLRTYVECKSVSSCSLLPSFLPSSPSFLHLYSPSLPPLFIHPVFPICLTMKVIYFITLHFLRCMYVDQYSYRLRDETAKDIFLLFRVIFL